MVHQRSGYGVAARRAKRVAASALALALLVTGCQAEPSGAPGNSIGVQSRRVSSLAVDAADGSLLKASGGLFRSADPGQGWKPLALFATAPADKISQVATSTAAPSSLFAAGLGAGIVRSDDRGQTWRHVSAGLPSLEVAAFAVHSFRPDTLFAWMKGEGVFRTEDGGARWQKMDAGPSAEILALAHSTLEGSMNTGWLYAATREGPYLSMDCF